MKKIPPAIAWAALRRALLWTVFGGLALLATAIAALYLMVHLLLAPRPGEWAVTVPAGPVKLELAVPGLLRLATAPWLGPRLADRHMDTRWGTLSTRWRSADDSLILVCSPCTVHLPALGPRPLQVEMLVATVRRDASGFDGTLEAGAPAAPLTARWHGQLQPEGMRVDIDAPAMPIARWYAALAPQLPELARAEIRGTLALRASLQLPGRQLTVQPAVTGFTVQGLGTEALAGAATQCGPSAGLRSDAWLSRAVIAAEDQRFDTHPGYDLQELMASLGANQQQAPNARAPARGGSTITQQLAKMLAVGDERSASRKLRELLYAVEMEQTLGKARILQLYLDNAPWGGNVCGAEAAARRWFGRSARHLAPAEAVWLAAMLHAPEVEAAQWQATGKVNVARAQSVAKGVRGVPGLTQRQRLAAADAVAAMGPPRAPAAKPAPQRKAAAAQE